MLDDGALHEGRLGQSGGDGDNMDQASLICLDGGLDFDQDHDLDGDGDLDFDFDCDLDLDGGDLNVDGDLDFAGDGDGPFGR